MIDTKSSVFRSELMEITPELADEFLRLNSRNRTTREGVVRQYAQMMREGRWDLSHEGIGFYEDGSLADGQHRLKAIKRANTPIQMLVTFGLKPSVYMNTGLKRTGADNLRIAGDDMQWVTPKQLSWVKLLNKEFPAIGCGEDNAKYGEYLRRYEHSFRWVAENYTASKAGLAMAGVNAALLCAHISGADTERLLRAIHYLSGGRVGGSEYSDKSVDTMLALRETLLEGRLGKGRMPGQRLRRDVMLCSGAAIKAYLDDVRKTKCEVPLTFAFPVYGLDGKVVYTPTGR